MAADTSGDLADLLRKVIDAQLKAAEAAPTERLMSELSRIHLAADVVEHHTEGLVRILRSRGVTWEEIGEQLGITRQAAWVRYAKAT